MKITENIEIVGLALKIDKTIVICDVHIGYEEALNKKGILMPRFQLEEIFERLENIFNRAGDIERIVINGDLKHEFGTISDQEWRDTLKLLDFLSEYGEVILVKGNHDTILGPIADKREIKVVDEFVIGDVLITHGDDIPKIDKKIKTIVIGHEHPAISLKDGAQIENFKCFLVGKYKRKNLVVQPSLNLVTEGNNVYSDERMSPFLERSLKNFRVYIVGEEVYDFGKLKDID